MELISKITNEQKEANPEKLGFRVRLLELDHPNYISFLILMNQNEISRNFTLCIIVA